MEADGERVRRHREQRGGLGDVDSEAEKQGDCRGASPDRGDLEPVYRETVVETCCAEVVEQARVDDGRTAEDDRLDHVATLALPARGRVAAEPASDAIADTGDAATPTEDAERLTSQDRVDALPAQPLRFVEAVRGSGWSPQLAQEPEPRALRRRAPEWELEQDRLVHGAGPPAQHERLPPLGERSRPGRVLDLNHRPIPCAGSGPENAAGEGGAPPAGPTPSDGGGR